MDGHLIRKCYNPQVTTLQLRNGYPEAVAVMFLRFATDWIFNGRNAPFILRYGRLRSTCSSKYPVNKYWVIGLSPSSVSGVVPDDVHYLWLVL